MNVIKPLCALGLVVAAAGTHAEISGEVDLFCEASDVVACAEGMCMQGPPGSFDLPHYMLIDVSDRVIRGVDNDGGQVSSPVLNTDVTDNAVILQGIENHRGWTLGIDRNDGTLTLSSTGADVNFIISGNCSERQGGSNDVNQ